MNEEIARLITACAIAVVIVGGVMWYCFASERAAHRRTKAEASAAPRKGTVNFNMREFETHREFAGNHPIGSNGFLTLVEFSLNQSYRHCRIGKIVLKSS